MKNTILIIASILMLALFSCGDEEKEPAPQVIEKQETIVLEKEVPAKVVTPPATTPPVADEESDGTSISVGEDGVEFSTKDGNNKTKVDLRKKGGSIKIEK